MDKKDNNNKIYLIIIAIVIIITCIVSFSFAYIGASTGDNRVNINGTVMNLTGALTMTYDYHGEFNYTITPEMLSVENIDKTLESDIGEIEIYLTARQSNYPNGARCEYRLEYHPTTAYTNIIPLLSDELFITGYVGSGGNIGEKTIVNKTDAVTIYQGIVTSSNPEYIYLQMGFKVKDQDQSGAIGQSPKGKFVVVPGECYKD